MWTLFISGAAVEGVTPGVLVAMATFAVLTTVPLAFLIYRWLMNPLHELQRTAAALE